MIYPAVGRHLWYRGQPHGGARYDAQPMTATVVYVWNERLVNLTVHDHEGQSFSVLSVHLRQRGDPKPMQSHYCEWPEYAKDEVTYQKQAEERMRLEQSLRAYDAPIDSELK